MDSVIDRLHRAGLSITLLPPDKVSVSPADRLNDELRELIRANKPMLMAWLEGTRLTTSHRLDVSAKLKASSADLDAQLMAAGVGLEVPLEPTAKAQGITVPPVLPPPCALKPHRPHIEANWLPLAQAYHLHHFKCPTCISAGQGRGLRCGAGAALWTGYQDASA